MAQSVLERVQADTREAMKSGDRERVRALRSLASALQKDAKLGDGDEVAALRRERKRRIEAADAFRNGGRTDSAEAEEAEVRMIESYLPEELSDDELEGLVGEVIEETGAQGMEDMGKVMGAAMGKVQGRAEGKRVNEAVRGRLGS